MTALDWVLLAVAFVVGFPVAVAFIGCLERLFDRDDRL